MPSIKRLCWALILLAIIHIPSKAYCVEIDPYAYKSLLGRITFDFQRSDHFQEGERVASSSQFSQTYSLDFRGFILTRNLLTYDAGVAYANRYSFQDSSRSENDDTSYYIRTTILPRSIIPLSFYGSRSVAEGETSEGPLPTTITKAWGLNWFGKFRVLPFTAFWADWNVTETAGVEGPLQSNYRLNMKKDIGITSNELDWNLITSDDSSSTGLSLRNSTNLSKRTRMSAAATTHKTESPASGESTTDGLSMNLTSRPGAEFYQRHSATYWASETETSTSGGLSYSGSLNYTVTENLNTSASVTVSRSETESATSASESEATGMNFGASYRLSRNLSLFQRISYGQIQSTTSEAGVSSLSDRTAFTESTGLSYGRGLGWADLGTSGSLGYRTETVNDVRGEGVDISASLNLSNINFNRYVGFDLGVSHDRTVELHDVWRNNYGFNMNAYNKYWTDYFSSRAAYAYSFLESWQSIENNKSEDFAISLSSSYFRNVNLGGNLTYGKRTNEVAGEATSLSRDMYISYSRSLFGGSLSLLASYIAVTASSPGVETEIKTTRYTALYNKRLMRKLSWQATLTRTESGNDTFKHTTALANAFTYQLRAWRLSATHDYTITEDPVRTFSDSRIFLRATRAFIRVF